MQTPPRPDDEHTRLLALAASGLLDTRAEERFDRLTRLTKRHFGVQICLISLVDSERQWFKSRQGLDACETDRAISFCGHAILSSEILEVPDALEDVRFTDNPLVTGPPFIRFYAGAPIAARNGQRIGTLCLIDARPRRLDDGERLALRDFADCVENEISTLRDQQLQTALKASRERAHGILRAMPDLVFVIRHDGIFVDCVEHPDLTRPVAEIIGRSAHEILPNHLANELCSKLRLTLETREEVGFEYRWTVGGAPQSFEARLKRINDKEVLLLARNVTHQRELQERLVQESRARREQAEHTRAIVEHIVDGIVAIDQHGIVESFNPAAERMFGIPAAEIIGGNMAMLLPNAHRPKHDGYLRNYLETGQKHIIGTSREMEAVRRDGSTFPIELTVSEVCQDERITFVGMIRDITRRKEAEAEVVRLAFYDPLTGLPNRRLLLDRLGHARANAQRHERHGALLYIDLDNFKTLNDSAGHHHGDALLISVANRLKAAVRSGDTVARLGGDEFVVMLENLSAEMELAASSAEHVAENILEALARPHRLDTIEHYGSGSIGVTLFNAGENHVEDLLKQADLAMYQAKAAGRNAIRFFDPLMQITVLERAALEKDLRSAVREHEFVPNFQLQVDAEGRPVGAELLLRWHHPQRGHVSPAAFIPLAEETGLIVPIGYDVLRAACETLAHWQTTPALAELTLAVNISLVQFRQTDFLATLQRILEASGADARRLKLEVTESLFAADVDGIAARLHAIKALGIAISLDDFGTGYSSLSYLKNLPLDQIKIDQSFVRDILDNPSDAAIARAVISLAESIGLDIIAEGVETEAQRDILAEIGCRRFQGYLFGKPMPRALFEAQLATPCTD